MLGKIKVLIVDDSAVIRQIISEVLSAEVDIEVLGAAADPLFALRRMETQWPDVIVLDLEMPRMGGLSFIRKIMAERPTPIVVCAALTQADSEQARSALHAGAVSVVPKPKIHGRDALGEQKHVLVDAIRAATKTRIRSGSTPTIAAKPNVLSTTLDGGGKTYTAVDLMAPGRRAEVEVTEPIIAIGTSTGGTEALETVLVSLAANTAAILVVQHMPPKFTESFAQRLHSVCAMDVEEATNSSPVQAGCVYIAPGGKHMLLRRSGSRYFIEIAEGPPISRHRPSVDVLFRSVANAAGRNALGVIMTGMGDDGADGLLAMRLCGADTVAQDQATSVVFGMPKEAIKRGAAARVLPLHSIAAEITRFRRA